MTARSLGRGAFLVAWLTLVWVCLWGDAEPGTVLAGIGVGVVVALVIRPGDPSPVRSTIRPWPTLRLLVWFAWALVRSTTLVAWEIVTPGSNLREGIVAIPVRGVSDTVVTVVANAITLTPGTLTVEVWREPCVLYVHVLHLEDIEDVRREGLELEARAIRAFGSAEAVAALDADEEVAR